MHFSKIFMLMFAAGAFGDKAPSLPHLSVVADAVADAPVLGRPEEKVALEAFPTETTETASKRGEDAARTFEASTALEEEFEGGPNGGGVADVMTAKTFGASANLRGTVAEETVSVAVMIMHMCCWSNYTSSFVIELH